MIYRTMDRSVAIANEFLRKPGGAALTQMQLQKLVFFAHGWSLGLTGNALTSEEPQAWDYGPVYPDLYDHTKYFGSGPIGRLITPDDDEAVRFFTKQKSGRPPYKADLRAQDESIINAVWDKYRAIPGTRLSSLTHRPGTPWSETYKRGEGRNRTITNKVIEKHYSKLAKVGE